MKMAKKLESAAVETIQWFLKKLNIELSYDPEILLLGVHPKEVKAGTQRFVYSCVWQHFSQQPKGGSMSTDWGMDKQNVRVHTMDLLSIKKEGHLDTYHNMDEPWRHYA